MDALLGSLTEAELSLVREVEPERLATLDEDALIELHTRIRRARNKHLKVYRRRAAATVPEVGGRGRARSRNTPNRAKVEVFEQALAQVSHRLAEAAEASAAALREDRIADTPEPRRTTTRGRPELRPQLLDRSPDNAGLRKRQASTRAVGARRQARRDSR